MGTRQLRISHPAQILEKIGGFLGKKINIVLHDNTSVAGMLIHLTGTEITVENMRLKKVRYPIPSIAEIIVDSPL